MTLTEMAVVLDQVTVPDFSFELLERSGVLFLRGRYKEGDIVTDDVQDQFTRKWLLSEHMVKSEIVQTAFKCYLTSLEHRAREHFKYRGKRIFGPHFDVDALHAICVDQFLDYRRDE